MREIHENALDIRNIRVLTAVSLLTALKIVFDFMTIQITPSLHFSFEFLVSALTGMLFGPAVSMISALVSDIVCYVLNPKGVYFIGFTLVAVLSGYLNGKFLFRQKITWGRIVSLRLLEVLLCNILLNTAFLVVLYTPSVLAGFPARVIKNAVSLPFETVILYFLLSRVQDFKQYIKWDGWK